MSAFKRIYIAILVSVVFMVNPAYSTLPNFYSFGTGATLGKLYTPTSPAIDIRNIMDATWNLSDGNSYVEKYLFTPPYPASPKAQKIAKEHAAEQGLVALFGNAFMENELIEIEVCDNNVSSSQANIINLSGNKLINFSISNTSLKEQSVANHKSVITPATMEKVLDNTVNLSGIKQASHVIKVGHQIILTTVNNKSD